MERSFHNAEEGSEKFNRFINLNLNDGIFRSDILLYGLMTMIVRSKALVIGSIINEIKR